MLRRTAHTLHIDWRAMVHLTRWLSADEVSRLLWSLSEGGLQCLDRILTEQIGAPCGEGMIEFREVRPCS